MSFGSSFGNKYDDAIKWVSFHVNLDNVISLSEAQRLAREAAISAARNNINPKTGKSRSPNGMLKMIESGELETWLAGKVRDNITKQQTKLEEERFVREEQDRANAAQKGKMRQPETLDTADVVL